MRPEAPSRNNLAQVRRNVLTVATGRWRDPALQDSFAAA
jgi:hypothetical protein